MSLCTICGGPEHPSLPPSTPESIVLGDLLVEPLDDGWCMHSSQPHSGWVELFATKEQALAEAHAWLERRKLMAEKADRLVEKLRLAGR